MMMATQNLMDEHEGIKLMLAIMESISKKMKSGRNVESVHLESILEFLKVFVDKCHHGKDEDVLFPELLEGKQGESVRKAVRILQTEHSAGRKYVRKIAETLSGYKKGYEKSIEITENMISYVFHMRKHIEIENNFFFPISDLMLNGNTQKKLFVKFEKIEIEKIGEGRHEEFHRLLRTLKKIYL